MAETFPSWRYGPGGQAMICTSAADVPKGWTDHPGKPSGEASPFDHDGDGRPGGSLPGKRRKVTRRGDSE